MYLLVLCISIYQKADDRVRTSDLLFTKSRIAVRKGPEKAILDGDLSRNTLFSLPFPRVSSSVGRQNGRQIDGHPSQISALRFAD